MYRRKFSHLGWQCSPRNHKLTKTPVLDTRNLLLKSWSRWSKWLPKQCRLPMKHLVSSRGLGPTAEDAAHIGYKTQTTHANLDLKSCSLQYSFHGSKKCYANCQEIETIKQSYPATAPRNHDKYQHSRICIQVSINSCLIRLMSHSPGGTSCWYWKPSQLSMVSEVVPPLC